MHDQPTPAAAIAAASRAIAAARQTDPTTDAGTDAIIGAGVVLVLAAAALWRSADGAASWADAAAAEAIARRVLGARGSGDETIEDAAALAEDDAAG